MGMQLGGSDEFNSEINVTPMVDVMLVLLIIFMVVTPLIQQGVQVSLPKDLVNPEPEAEIIKDTSVVVAVTEKGVIHIGSTPYSDLEILGSEIAKRVEALDAGKKIVYVKADEGVRYEAVVNAVNVIRKQDVDRVGLVVEKRKEKKD